VILVHAKRPDISLDDIVEQHHEDTSPDKITDRAHAMIITTPAPTSCLHGA